MLNYYKTITQYLDYSVYDSMCTFCLCVEKLLMKKKLQLVIKK